MKNYFKKFSQLETKKRLEIYILCMMVSLITVNIAENFSFIQEISFFILVLLAVVILVSMEKDKTKTTIKSAEEKTEVIFDGKSYNIKASKLIHKTTYSYWYSRVDNIREYRLCQSLYQSEKGAYFLYTICRYDKFELQLLSDSQSKDWLLANNVDCYKRVFGEIEEA